MHRHVCVKVNAWVDEGIASLIEALSRIEGLTTFESCQELFPGEANVFFTYGYSSNWNALLKLCFRLSEKIRELNPDAGVTVSLEWKGSNDRPYGRISVAPQYADAIAKTIKTFFS